MLAALALTAALVGVILPFAGRLVERWWTGAQRIDQADAWQQATARLSADLAETIPLISADGPPRLMFKLARNSVVLVRPALAGNSPGARELVAYVIERAPQGEALLRRSAAYDPTLIDADPRVLGAPTAILAGPYHFAFAALGSDLVRVETWTNSGELPQRVELAAISTGRDPVPPVPLVLPIMARAPPAAPGAPAKGATSTAAR
jgi:hypothetical protein